MIEVERRGPAHRALARERRGVGILRLARNHGLAGREPPRHALHGTGRDSDLVDLVARHGHRGSDVYEREVPGVPVGDLLEVEARAGPIHRQTNRSEHLTVLEHGHAGDVDVRADEEFLGLDLALALRPHDYHLGIEHHERRSGVRRAHGHAAIGAVQAVLAILTFGRIGVAAISAGAIAVHAVAVVPATGVLADVAADRAGVPD